HHSIGWAVDNKNTDKLYASIADDPDLFFFNPEDSAVIGFARFKEQVEQVFLNEAFKAVRYEIRDLRIHLSESGTVAWYSCRLDDMNEWNGQPANWINCRWTGVLEKRKGGWAIMQMHFSFPQGLGGGE
ncbi:MAG: nuclear transport factor 2 family protein, partial [Planctomycetes bacterium]|nr:nuclear transport factor 2 family protein [Planctomycetota bacterium]